MTDREKIKLFKEYLIGKGYDKEKIDYNVSVVELLSNRVLYFFNEELENIDTYTFEEFTDMVTLIDEKLGGRDGIPKMLDSMLELTEFLKINKLIKGGKIAHYKRMFSNVDYYLDKYDKITGKKDDSKDYVKDILSSRLGSSVVKLLEEVNVYNLKTLNVIDKLLNDIPLDTEDHDNNSALIKEALISAQLIEEKGNIIETTKRGRVISRLSAEEQYAAILYIFIYIVDWKSIIKKSGGNVDDFDFRSICSIAATIFNKNSEVIIEFEKVCNIDEDKVFLEIASDRFRIARIESMPIGSNILDICFAGMGILSINIINNSEVKYSTSEFGQNIFKLLYNEILCNIKMDIEFIGFSLRDKDYSKAEKEILNFLSTYGGNTVVWDCFGQVLLINKNYKQAYTVLKYAYECSSKRGKAAKSLLYHLVLCCRKLKLNEDIETYESKLQHMERA